MQVKKKPALMAGFFVSGMPNVTLSSFSQFRIPARRLPLVSFPAHSLDPAFQ